MSRFTAVHDVVGSVVLALEARNRGDRTDVTRELSLAQIADELAIAVAKQWQDEAQMRRLNDPHPLPVGWHPADLARCPLPDMNTRRVEPDRPEGA